MTRLLATAALVFSFAAGSLPAQVEGPAPTQVLVNVDPKSAPLGGTNAVTVQVDGRKEPLSAWEPVVPGNAQVALLIDDGLRESMGRVLSEIQGFVASLPPGIEVLVGYMQFGHVAVEQPFTTEHAQAAATVHLPEGIPGESASPYICLSDFERNWPGSDAASSSTPGAAAQRKARFIIVITDGVDPYNGSTSVMNQDSPYVDAATQDAMRAGVVVYSIYFADAGIRGARADNSGQNYLTEMSGATGAVNLWEGMGNPVDFTPLFRQFEQAVAETYVATFVAPAGKNPQKDMVHVKFNAGKTKLHAPNEVLPGNRE